MKKTNFLMLILGTVSYFVLLVFIDIKPPIVDIGFLIVTIIIIITFANFTASNAKGINLRKTDFKIGSKIKVLYNLSVEKNEKTYHYFLVQMEDEDVTLLTENKQSLELGKSYILNSKKNWEEVN